ncbi:MAG: RNA-binding S4 domain-containing protein [Bacteroidetes bacterium]|nr:RNA-binding S4 domain-containing protein [Bacteroidota bacterium]
MKKQFNRKKFDSRPRRDSDDKKERGEKKDWGKGNSRSNNRVGNNKHERREEKPWEKKRFDREQKPWEKRRDEKRYDRKKSFVEKKEQNLKKAFERSEKTNHVSAPKIIPPAEGLIRLNKYLANAGICSRREADKFIEAGAVKVNGKIITQLGYKVSPGDKVQFGDNRVQKEKTVYILLNKPKGYITTTDDERNRATVLDLIQGVEERIYPVGRLDRNTSGLLLLTNDGELAKTLMHPKYRVPKVYHIVLDKSLKPDDLDKLKNGVELEDGFAKPDDIAYVEGTEGRKDIGIEIHSGRNRIVRRMFEHLGYNVVKLDRVLYAGLTKKNISRGKWRFLAENEVRMLKRIK